MYIYIYTYEFYFYWWICGTKIALKDLDLFNKLSLPFDGIRTSIEGIIDCIENNFENYFPKEIKKIIGFQIE